MATKKESQCRVGNEAGKLDRCQKLMMETKVGDEWENGDDVKKGRRQVIRG